MSVSLDQTMAHLRIDELRRLGYTGRGVRVAVIDSGIDPMYSHKIVAEKSFVGGNAADEDGHGTHVTSILLGMAPDVEIINVKIFGPGLDTPMDIGMMGMEWAAAQGADILNCSWGGYHYAAIHGFIQELAAKAVITVAASGNWELACPGDSRDAVSVGSIAVRDPAPDHVAEFSGRGPAYDFHVEPDVMAPGGSSVECIAGKGLGGAPLCLKGTSMSAPHVSGGLALLYEAYGNKVLVVDALYKAASDLGMAKTNEYGYGTADFGKSYELLQTGVVEPIEEPVSPLVAAAAMGILLLLITRL